jgi:hypothetical protein
VTYIAVVLSDSAGKYKRVDTAIAAAKEAIYLLPA